MGIPESDEHNFFVLLEAVVREPWKVADIVNGNSRILEAKNSLGENVLHYLAVENKLEEVRMLRALGSTIPSRSISESLSVGHLDMVALLLELGGDPVVSSCNLSLKSDTFTKKRKYEIRGLFRAYGYTLEEIQ